MTLSVAALLGCSVAPGQGIADFGRDAQGNAILLDTQKNWEDWIDLTNWRVELERRGEPYANGSRTWDEFWVDLILSNERGVRENPMRYIRYVIDHRGAVGLPPIRGLPDRFAGPVYQLELTRLPD